MQNPTDMRDNTKFESYPHLYFPSQDVSEYDIEDDEVIEVPATLHHHPRSSCESRTLRTAYKKLFMVHREMWEVKKRETKLEVVTKEQIF